jgi:hypothetical protein
MQIGVLLKRSFGDPCFQGEVADQDPAPGLQADCTVSDVQRLPDGTDKELAILPACDATRSNIPCWHLEADADRCYYTDSKLAIIVERNGAVPPSDIHVKASCVTTDPAGQVQ